MTEHDCEICNKYLHKFNLITGNCPDPNISLELHISKDGEPAARLAVYNSERTMGSFIYITYCPACGKKLTQVPLDGMW